MPDNPHRRAPLPLTIPRQVQCNFCGRIIIAIPTEGGYQGNGSYQFLVDHGPLYEATLELEGIDHMRICPNNGKRWVVEFQQPWIYEMDPVTGEIDTFGGRVV